MTLFKHVFEGMEDNNVYNDGCFSDWKTSENAIEAYGETFTWECDFKEMKITKECLQIIIDSNGLELEKAISYYNNQVWGQNFEDNNGLVIFGG